jgi:hypothetical protein
MIANPPHIAYLLRAYALLAGMGFPESNITAAMAAEFHRKLGPMEWPAFQTIYHLYLQQIPAHLARAAWGLNEARGLNRTPASKPHSHPQ